MNYSGGTSLHGAASERGSRTEHVLVRLADEGIPVAAIARAMKRPMSEVWDVLKEALDRGEIVSLPAADWPPGTRREQRTPSAAPIRLKEAENFEFPLQRVFGLTVSESRCLAILLARREVPRPSLHVAMSGDDSVSHPKIVDVMICKIRRKLSPYQIRIETIWGRGYALSSESAKAIMARLKDFDRQEMVV